MKFPCALVTGLMIGHSVCYAQTPEVRVGLDRWQQTRDAIAQLKATPPPPAAVSVVRRTFDARYRRGVLTGALDVIVEVHSDEPTTFIPLISKEASLAAVRVDGKPAVATRRGDLYGVVSPGTGRRRVQLEFAFGREGARFSRSFSMVVPPSPVTTLHIDIAEPDITLDIDGGVIVSKSTTAKNTRITAALGALGVIAARWTPRANHAQTATREMEVESAALASISEDLVLTRTGLSYRLLTGETDRVEAEIGTQLEVTAVRGQSVLQWYTDTTGGGSKRLVVLLKHLVDSRLEIVVEAQQPIGDSGSAQLAFIRPTDAALRRGYVAVEGRPGFDVAVENVADASEIGPREVPPQLTKMSDRPILFAYSHATTWPQVKLSIKRNARIELTQAVIDDLQASTVLVEQGLQITKMRLYVRNNTRQYLRMRLPSGAELTHALIDGRPFHPATTIEGEEVLLVPLPQSEKLSANPRKHVVRPGETLSGISMLYFNRTDNWQAILDENPEMYGSSELYEGQNIDIPGRSGDVKLEESNFVLELAYKRRTQALSGFGQSSLRMPVMDIPVMQATWHVYFPNAFEPLEFDSNLVQLSAVRYDLLRRATDFFERAFSIDEVWASGGPRTYSNILKSRKAIYRQERKQHVTEALAEFPLVGERYRFSSVLLGERVAKIDITYARRSLLPWVRWGAFLLAALLAFFAVARHSGRSVAVLALAAIGLAVGGHWILGVHRATLLGIDVGLAAAIAPSVLGRFFTWFRERIRTPFDPTRLWRMSTVLRLVIACAAIGILLCYPLLLSASAFVALTALAVRRIRHA